MTSRQALTGGIALAALVLLALGVLRGEAFWTTSDGVYMLTARGVRQGNRLYHDVAAAQPPPVYWAGAALLWLSDGLTMLRAGLEVVMLLTAGLVGLAVLRLTGAPRAALVACVLAPLTPMVLYQNALLTPETLALPLLMGTALLAAGPDRWLPAAGLLGALTLTAKVPFVLPVVLVLAAGRTPRRTIAWALGGAVLLALLGWAICGTELWRSVVVAQRQSGFTTLDGVGGLLAQEVWNELPLALIAAAGVWLGRSRAADAPLLRTLVAAAVGGLLLGGSVIKEGSYLNVIELAEPPLLALAVAGSVWLAPAVRPPGELGVDSPARWHVPALLLAALAALLLVLQSGSLLVQPDDPKLLTRPGADSGPRRLLSPDEVRTFAAGARRCPADRGYPGIPFVAFVAGRRAPGDQPDGFILGSQENARFAERAVRDQLCPQIAPTVDPRGDIINR